MKKAIKIILIILLVMVAGIAAIGFYVKKALPDVGAPEELTIERTPARIERGKYLANHVTLCMDCHSVRDWSLHAGPPIPGPMGGGGERFGEEIGIPGTIYSRNITPYGIGNWTDGELFRAITTGVSRDGHALFPLMPYANYGKMDREDIYSIISYIRTLPAVKKDIPPAELNFPVNFIVNTMPQKTAFTTRPDSLDEIAYGRYMINAAACMDCHSQFDDKGNMVPGTEFGGGREFIFPGGIVTSANLTTDPTGILASLTREGFIRRFKEYTDSSYQPEKVNPTDFNTPMPWMMYANMTEKDLGAIYAYLKTVKPMVNEVIKFRKKEAVVKK